MKLKSDMLIMEAGNDALRIQIIGRDDVPRVEKEGRGWRDGATVLLKGADVAEFLDAISSISGRYEIGDSGLSAEFEDDETSELNVFVLSTKGVSIRFTWPERMMLLDAVRGLAWRMFQ